MLKRILLSRLTLSQDIYSNTNKIILRVCNSSAYALKKKIVSYANCRWDTLVLFLLALKPSNNLLPSTLNIILLNTSTTMVKKKTDKGSPCLSPLIALTQPLAFPFTRIAKVTKDKQLPIQVLHLRLNPFSSNT